MFSKLFSLASLAPGLQPIVPPPNFDDGLEVNSALSVIGDFFGGIWDGVLSIADLANSAWEGANTILDYITDFLPSYEVFVDILPGPVESIAVSIIAVLSTVVTFKVVGYFT